MLQNGYRWIPIPLFSGVFVFITVHGRKYISSGTDVQRVWVCVMRGLSTYNLRVYNNIIVPLIRPPSLTNSRVVAAWRSETRLTDYIRPTHERANPLAVTFSSHLHRRRRFSHWYAHKLIYINLFLSLSLSIFSLTCPSVRISESVRVCVRTNNHIATAVVLEVQIFRIHPNNIITIYRISHNNDNNNNNM